jgi:hypothetical protein
MLESLRMLGHPGGGFAVAEDGTSPQTLAALDAAGITGLRINLESAAPG